jgi:hypothetical protein
VMVMGLKAGQQVTTSPDVENPLQHPGARPLFTTHLPIQNGGFCCGLPLVAAQKFGAAI